MDDSDEEWQALYARIRDGEQPTPEKMTEPDRFGVEIGKRIPAKGVE